MKYLGSKANHADEILAIILAKRKPGQWYVEPFVGGANVMSRVPQAQGPRLGADLNPYMVALHTALGAGWQPPREMTKAEYMAIKKNPKAFPPELVAFAATGCSFGSMWFGEWVKPEKEGDSRCRQSADSCLRDAPGLAGAKFMAVSYKDLVIPANSLVYCDPPYVGTTGYDGAKTTIMVGESNGKNDWKAGPFWRWADSLVEAGHTVFVSEYTAPQASAYSGIVKPSEALVAARLKHRALVADENSSSADIEEAAAAIEAENRAMLQPAQAMANRWEVVWHKDVVSDFSASREEGTAKTETEKLFHRST